MTYPAEVSFAGEWADVRTVGCSNDKVQGESKGKGKEGKGTWKCSGNGQTERPRGRTTFLTVVPTAERRGTRPRSVASE